MSFFHRPGDLDSEQTSPPRSPRGLGIYMSRIANWFAGLDPEPRRELESPPDPVAELSPYPEPPGPEPDQAPSRFPLAPLGYNRVAVDERIAELEREIEELRAKGPLPSITEELERIGEQTASILVVAHDQAHETTRRAQEQAEHCVANATDRAAAITAEAETRLRTIDGETDAVWREREKLLEDVRSVSTSLADLARDASARFPADSDTVQWRPDQGQPTVEWQPATTDWQPEPTSDWQPEPTSDWQPEPISDWPEDPPPT